MTNPVEDRGSRKTREGIVVSDKMDKTITVEVSNRVSHGMQSEIIFQLSYMDHAIVWCASFS